MIKENYQDYLAWTYFGKNALDRAEFVRFKELLKGTKRFIDVGASHGVYTYHANKILKNSEIFAIEADPERFGILQKNVKTWAAESTNNIYCINAAASDEADRQESDEITFFATGTQISGGLFPVSERSDDYIPTNIPLICIDEGTSAQDPENERCLIRALQVLKAKGRTILMIAHRQQIGRAHV